MTSPMRSPRLHDQLVLLDGSKRWPVPGVSRVSVELKANVDAQDTPGDGKAVTQLNEATAEIDVTVTMWTHEQWEAYKHLLAFLRRGTKDGPAVFTSAHPELRARRVKRLYFVSESAQSYSPREGYKTTLKFSEKLKEKAATKALGDEGQIVVPGDAAPAMVTLRPLVNNTASLAAQANLVNTPRPSRDGASTTATPGSCSTWARWSGADAGMDQALFGASALATEGNFKRAKLSAPWTLDSQKNVQPGDFVFFANDPSGYGHVGQVVGFDTDGMPLIAGNNLVTYRQKGGRFDAGGRPIDRNIDSRGTVRLDQLSGRNSQPTSIGRAGGFPNTPRLIGPAVPVGLPAGRPSANLPGPR